MSEDEIHLNSDQENLITKPKRTRKKKDEIEITTDNIENHDVEKPKKTRKKKEVDNINNTDNIEEKPKRTRKKKEVIKDDVENNDIGDKPKRSRKKKEDVDLNKLLKDNVKTYDHWQILNNFIEDFSKGLGFGEKGENE